MDCEPARTTRHRLVASAALAVAIIAALLWWPERTEPLADDAPPVTAPRPPAAHGEPAPPLVRSGDAESPPAGGGIDVEGRVVDATGAGVAGCRIELSDGTATGKRFTAAKSGADGRFRVLAVEPGRFVGAVSKHWTPSRRLRIEGEPGSRTTVTLKLGGRGGSLAGRILDDANGKPIASALLLGVAYEKSGGSRSSQRPAGQPRTTSDDRGRVRLDGLVPGRILFVVHADGYRRKLAGAEIEAGKVARFELRLEATVTIEGRVTTRDGEPAADVRVEVGGPNLRRRRLGVLGVMLDLGHEFEKPRPRAARTDADGHYRLTRLHAGRTVVRAKAGDRGKAQAVFRTEPGQVVIWNPTLDAGLVIRGRILYLDGKPAVGRWVSLAGTTRVDRTDGAGNFTFTDCADRSYIIHVRDQPQVGGFVCAAFRDQRPAPEPRVLRFARSRLSSARIDGVLLSPAGQPYPRFNVQIEQVLVGEERLPTWFASTRHDGRFLSTLMPPGRYRVLLRLPRRPPILVGNYELRPRQTLSLGKVRR